MRRRVLLAAALATTIAGAGALAQDAATDPISQRVRDVGLSAALAELETETAPSPKQRYAIGGLRFLRAIERSLQARWRAGAEPIEYAPVLRLPLPLNPNPEPFDAALYEALFTEVRDDMAAALAALEPAPSGFKLRIDLADLWFDIDMNGKRATGHDGEDLMTVAMGAGLATRSNAPGGQAPSLVVAFDDADAAWLKAYAHLISGVAEIALSLDTEAAIRAASAAWEAEARYGAARNTEEMSSIADQVLPLLLMLRGAPDATHTKAALEHWRSMISNNRRFWTEVRDETDNDAEWIPNPRQQSAMGGATISAEVANAWVAVLGDIDQMLNGELLVPHWRYGPDSGDTVGVNLRRLMESPQSFDIAMWMQGAAAAPYLERGPLIDGAAWNNFTRAISGDAVLYAIWLN